MSNESRVWVYQMDRAIGDEEALEIASQSEKFCEQWVAHNQPLKASFKLFYNHFLVIAVDESFNQASGCSIDASVHLVKQLEQNFNLNFFDRTQVAFLDKGNVFLESISNLKTGIVEGKIDEQTLTFNNLVKNKEELENRWIVSALESWIKRYFKAVEQH